MEKIDQALYEVRVFTETTTWWGIPSTLFIGAAAITALTLFELPWYVAMTVGTILFITLYFIHEKDPKGLTAWLSIVKSPKQFSAEIRQADSIHFL
jgi:hypothetical protein